MNSRAQRAKASLYKIKGALIRPGYILPRIKGLNRPYPDRRRNNTADTANITIGGNRYATR